MPDGDARTLIVLAARAKLARLKLLKAQKAEAEDSLLAFVRLFWRVLEPEKPLVEGWLLELLTDTLMAITDGHLTRVGINVVPGSMKSSLLNVLWPAWEWGPQNMPHLRYLSVSYSRIVPERDNIRFARLINDPVYQSLWGDRVKLVREGTEVVENSATGSKRVTSTGGSITGLRGDRLLLDDLNNPMDVESDEVRQTTERFVREIMPDRLNDLNESAIINLQQRTHEQDATGILLEHGQDYTFICVPMEFDPLRARPVVLRRHEDGSPDVVWQDPRGLDEDGEPLDGLYTTERGELRVRDGSPMARAEGALCWPERFPRDAVIKLQAIKGPYAWDCNPYEAPILMADLTLKPLGEIEVGDEIVGFEADCDPRRDGEKFARRRLLKTVVRDIHSAVRPVVRITLDSGRVIRCTPNHKWYTGRSPNDATHPVYAPAKVGRPLMRVCDPELPQLTEPDDFRLAGWLGGFFDGEGTVSVQHRRVDAKQPTAIISFAQTVERNLNLCEKLEHALTHFQFIWGVSIKGAERRNPLRMYWLKRGGLPVYQRFLHIAQPAKWRNRIINNALRSGFIQARERVVSIETDGEDTVYGLTTDTGNYVVWGLASSNSQFQQFPGVRGGGIIRKDWWKLWARDDYPELGTVIIGVDTAVEEGNQNDYNACQAWGAFAGLNGEPLMLLLDAWRARLPLAQLVARIAETCRRRNADYLLIEHKTRGRDVHDEIVRLYQSATWQTILVKAEVSKVSRLKAVEHLFSGDYRKDPNGVESWSGGLVYAPDRDFADAVINEVASFPYGAHDDQVDVTSMVLGWVRKNGVVLRRVEFDDEETERARYRRTPSVPYAI